MIYVKPEVGDTLVYVGLKNANEAQLKFAKEHKRFTSLIEGKSFIVTAIADSNYSEVMLWIYINKLDYYPLFMFEQPAKPSFLKSLLQERFKILAPEQK